MFQAIVIDIQTLILAVDQADSSTRLLEAVQNLASVGTADAIPTLITALGYNNPGAAVAAVDGLIRLGDAAVVPLLEQLDGYNYGARAWAVRALAGIGDPRGLDILLSAAKNDFAMSVRRAATRGLGTIDWEKLDSNPKQSAQSQALEALLQVSHDHEWVVRYAAVLSLQSLAIAVAKTRPDWFAQIQSHLNHLAQTDESLTIRARVQFAQQKLQEPSPISIR
ncbi:HEAT repeat domain-containing protein [Phormidesmis priestleyi]